MRREFTGPKIGDPWWRKQFAIAGRSMSEVARVAEVSTATLSRHLAGIGIASVKEARALAHELKVPIEQVLKHLK
jgi:DNA-binding MurR/RpiR family transcriptional regulator